MLDKYSKMNIIIVPLYGLKSHILGLLNEPTYMYDDAAKTVKKAFSILRAFTPEEPTLSVLEIIKKVGMPKATVHRLVKTLVQMRLLEKDHVKGKYKVGPELYILGSLYLGTMDVLKAAQPVVKRVNELTEEAVIIGIVDSVDMTVLMKEEALHALRYAHPVGTSIPAHASATGKALLSVLTEEEIERRFPSENLRHVTVRTINTKAELKRDLENIRKNGVSIDVEGSVLGVVGIAAVIHDSNGDAVAAISIPTPISRLNSRKIEKLGQLAKRAAGLISYRLGYQDSEAPARDVDELSEWWEKNKDNNVMFERALPGEI
jgi:DNA-binding IclR family transcriptional regulator